MRNHLICNILFSFVAIGQWLQPVTSHAQAPGPALTVLVRHADRDPGFDPPLNDAGMKRVQDLAATLRDAKFSAIITSDFVRTRDTAKPVAEMLGLAPIEIRYKNVERDAHVKAVVEAVGKQTGGAVLVVGHSETLKDIIAGIGGPRFANDICGNVYDHLFLLVQVAGRIQLVNSRYGQPSPPPQGNCM